MGIFQDKLWLDIVRLSYTECTTSDISSYFIECADYTILFLYFSTALWAFVSTDLTIIQIIIILNIIKGDQA
jgi:hypothetical protein